ncbi:MAG TPA: LamG domain-containing protein [Pyrinomonadaceae bacterium]|nr:LamG domain-containing protein [Pyrinomonadaceae bacterium]
MSKQARRRRKLSQPDRRGPNRRKALLAACLAFGLVAAALVSARWVSTSPAPAALAPAPLAPLPTPTTTLSKEYIYAGGKLIATEEPPAATPGSGGYSLSLNGASAHAQVSHSASLNITGALTVEAWVKYNSNGTYQEIVAKECYATAGCGGYALQLTNTGKLRFILYQGGTSYVAVVGATTVSTGVWHHVAGVFDGTNQRRVYLDGVEDGSASSAGSAPASGTAPLQIGRLNSSTLYYFNGQIDEVRVSNSALYNATFTPQASLTGGASTKGLWKFNDQTANDTSGNGNNGTLQGGAGYLADAP